MSDHERGAYTPPTDAPLSFDARQPVRGARPIPFTLIVSILVLAGLAAAIFVFYRSGVRRSGEAPQTMGVPVGQMKAVAPPEQQPADPAAGLQIYHAEGGQPAATAGGQPKFAPPPELPQARPGPAAPKVVVARLPSAPPPATSTSTTSVPLRPAIQASPPSPALVAKPAPTAPPLIAKTPAARPAPTSAPVAHAGAASVQIGAFSSQALADNGWNDATAIAPGAAAGKGKSVEKIDKDGKTLFRTTVTGFASRTDAAAFCDRLKASGKACFVK